MKIVFCSAIVALLISGVAAPASPRKKAAREPTSNKAEIEAATRLQIFLDRGNFSPGKIDGRYGDFTWKALALYRESLGAQPQTPPSHGKTKSDVAPDVTGLDLASVDPIFIPYILTEVDLQSVGPLPSEVSAQAKLKFLPYRSVAEAIAEKFHSDVHLLEQLNPGKTKTLKSGDQILVPNVEPFDLASVKEIKPGSEVTAQVVNDVEEEPDAQTKNAGENTEKPKNEAAPAPFAVKIDTKTNTLGVFEGDKIFAAYPVTIGSTETE
jgi:lipoprotein-anchoring transpeptidase ErfK/SrfK